MFVGILTVFVCFIGAISAGGESGCNGIVQETLVNFQQYNLNVTQQKLDCEKQIAEYRLSSASLPIDERKTGFEAIKTGCSNAILGFMLQTVTDMGENIEVDPNDLLEIVTGSTKLPVALPVQCIAKDLVNLFDQAMEADAEFTSNIDKILKS